MNKEKGKCFSACNQGQRNKSDFYQTPISITKQLFESYLGFAKNHSVLEPCCGEKAIVKVLNEYFYKDKVSYFDLNLNGKDFLKDDIKFYDYIITNPPFKYALEFVLRCKEIAREKFALLLPLSYLHGKKRYDLIYNRQNLIMTNFRYEEKTVVKSTKKGKIKSLSKIPKYDLKESEDFRLKYVLPFTRYPLLTDSIREDGKYKTGCICYSWFIWDKSYTGDPIIKWIDNNEYVLSEKKNSNKYKIIF